MPFNPLRRHCEAGAAGSFAEKYAGNGDIRRLPAPRTPPTACVRSFFIEDATVLREATDDTTAAIEITLRTRKAKHFHRFRKELQAGLVFAMEPKNDAETVQAVLNELGMEEENIARKRQVNVHSAFLHSNSTQRLNAREILTSTKDLSRPTVQLVNLMLERAGRAGDFTSEQVEKITQCYHVLQLLEHFKGYITLTDLIANQPELRSRPYTLSDFDNKTGQVKIIVSDVKVGLDTADPLGIKPEGQQHVKLGGNATNMLMDLAGLRQATNPKAGDKLRPDSHYPINGLVFTQMPRLLFPGLKATRSVQGWVNSKDGEHHKEMYNAFSERTFSSEDIFYLLATGSGIAPYMAELRRLKRQPPAPATLPKMVLINGGRSEKNEILREEIEEYIKDGLLKDYYFACSRERKIFHSYRNPEGEVERSEISPKGKGCHVQDVLAQEFGDDWVSQLENGTAIAYICGNRDAQDGLEAVIGDEEKVAALKQNASLQGTASKPDRMFTSWHKDNKAVCYRLLDVPKLPYWRFAKQRGAGTDSDAWSQAVPHNRG